jgi:hypothetical protein
VLACLCAPPVARGQEAGAAVYVRHDDDHTTVVTPRLRVKAPVGEATTAEAVYSVDVWSSASIDIRTSASKRIVEQRDELDFNLGHDFDTLRLTGGYRYSTEPDYESHGGSVGAELDLAQRSTTLSATVTGTFDRVGRVGDAQFWRDASLVSVRVGVTQVLDPSTLVELLYEPAVQRGYLSSPYRQVGIGGEDGRCLGEVEYCLRESNPTERTRHAIALRAVRALGDQLSVNAGYRLYADDWALHSHTVEVGVSFMPDEPTLLSLAYRLYLQDAASHYRARYPDLRDDGLYTSDKELSPMSAHRVALELERAFALGEGPGELTAVLSLGPTFYHYDDYLPLQEVTAWEVTLSTVVSP